MDQSLPLIAARTLSVLQAAGQRGMFVIVDAGPKAIALTPWHGTAPEDLLDGASRHERAASRIEDRRLLFAIDEAVEAGERLTLTTHPLQTLA